MRRPIDTVPKDGRKVILDDDVTGTHELARWSAETSTWVTQDGKTCVLNPTHWLALQRNEQLAEERPEQPLISGEVSSNIRKSPISPDHELTGPPATEAPPLAPSLALSFVKPEEAKKKRGSFTARRIKLFCGLTMIVISLSGMCFRAEIAALLTGHVPDHVHAAPENNLQNPPSNVAALAVPSGLDTARPEENPTPEERRETNEIHTSVNGLIRELTRLREEVASKDTQYKTAMVTARQREIELKRAADAATDFQRALEQAQRRIETLQKQLTVREQRGQQTTQSSRQLQTTPARQQRTQNHDGFFGN